MQSHYSMMRERESSFFRRLWQEIDAIRIVDTHEHFDTMKKWRDRLDTNEKNRGERRLLIPDILERSYIRLRHEGSCADWAAELHHHVGTGYLKAWLVAMEDLHGIPAGPITSSYLQRVEDVINESYRDDIENDTCKHLERVLEDNMHVDAVLLDIWPGDHETMPVSCRRSAAGIPSVLDGVRPPTSVTEALDSGNVVYWFACSHLGMNPEGFTSLDDYCTATEKLYL